jgi:hypothetical protein
MNVDLRGPLLPADELSHVRRINNWLGSDSNVEGHRRDRGEHPMPHLGEKHPYALTLKAFHEGRMMPAGSTVFIYPSERGFHHAAVPGHEYPAEAQSPIDANSLLYDLQGHVGQLEQDIRALHDMIAERDDKIVGLESALVAAQQALTEATRSKKKSE